MGVRSTGSHPTTTKADGHLLEYFRQTFGGGGGGTNAPPPPSGLTATGGVISDYTSTIFIEHMFLHHQELFNVSALLGGFPQLLIIWSLLVVVAEEKKVVAVVLVV